MSSSDQVCSQHSCVRSRAWYDGACMYALSLVEGVLNAFLTSCTRTQLSEAEHQALLRLAGRGGVGGGSGGAQQQQQQQTRTDYDALRDHFRFGGQEDESSCA